MQIAEKIFLIIADLLQQIWANGAFYLFAAIVAATLLLWLSASFWQSQLKHLTEGKSFFQRDWFYFLIIGTIASSLFVSYAGIYGWPVPRVHDENCYLLMAKTFAAGRLTNSPHPLWQFFEHFHLINQPTYTAKYPPAQAAFLALGILFFNQAIVGVWLSGVLAALICFWMLRTFFSCNWALVGALLFLTHPTLFEWNQNYWGGNVAFIGGALCVGGLFRSFKNPQIMSAVIFAVGVALLANSRPFEGLLACIPLAAAFIHLIIKRFRQTVILKRVLLNFILPVSLILSINFSWMAFYNWRVTGNSLKLPYSLYTEQYDPVPLFLPFSSPNRGLSYRHQVMKIFYENELENHYQLLRQGMTRATLPGLIVKRSFNEAIDFFAATLFFYLSVLLLGAAVFRLHKKYFFFGGAFFFCLLLEACATYNQNHYYAPFVPFLIVTITAALALFSRQTKAGSVKNSFVSFVLASILMQLTWVLTMPLLFEKHLPDADNSQFNFQKIFANMPDKHLVLVDYTTGDLEKNDGRYHQLTVMSWVYNEPSIDQAKVVWANGMGPAQDRQLFDYFRDRHVWVLGFDELNNARLMSCENLFSPAQPEGNLEFKLRKQCPEM